MIKAGWQIYKIKDIAKVITGSTPSKKYPEDWGNDILFITPSDYKKYKKWCYDSDRKLSVIGKRRLLKRLLPKNSILVTCIGSDMGKVVITPKEVITNQQINSLIVNSDISFNYVFYFLSSISNELKNLGSSGGTAVPILNKSIFENLEIELPPLSEQRAIAEVLSSLDDKIDMLHRQNKTLEQMAETLFRQWFVEPVRRSDSEGGEAEDSWENGRLGDVIELVYGKGLKKEIRTGEGFPVVGSSGVVDYHSEFLVKGPGIVIGRKGTLGKTIYLWDNFFPIDTTYYVKSKVESTELLYEYFLLKTLNFEEMNSDSAVPGLNRDIALSTEIKIPPFEKLKNFNKSASKLVNKMRLNKSQIRTLEKLRDTLLPKLMSGEVRVKTNN